MADLSGITMGSAADTMFALDNQRLAERGVSLKERVQAFEEQKFATEQENLIDKGKKEAVKTFNENLKSLFTAIKEIDLTTPEGKKEVAAARKVFASLVDNFEAQVGEVAPQLSGIGRGRLAALDAAIRNKQTQDEQALAEGKAERQKLTGMLGRKPTDSEVEKKAGVDVSAQSPLGKLMSDRERAVKEFGPDSPQVKAFDAAIADEQKGEGGPKLTDIAGLRKEFTKLSGDFLDTQAAYGRILSTPDTAAGDVGLVFNFMKMLDPTSVVREGEFALAAAAAGLPDRIVQLARRVDTGERLTPPQRTDFRNVARGVYADRLKEHKQREEVFRGLASRQNIPPDQVVVDFVRSNLGKEPEPLNEQSTGDIPTVSTQAEVEKLEPGAKFIWGPDGLEYTRDPVRK